jgi:hypothetical protein
MFEAGHAEGLNSNCFGTGVDGAEDIMNLKDAFLCIDCDEVFAIDGSPSNPRCPRCASSVFAPLSAWVQSWAGVDHSQSETTRAMRIGASTERPRLEIVHPAPIAA